MPQRGCKVTTQNEHQIGAITAGLGGRKMMLDPNFNIDDMNKEIERWDRIDRWTVTGLYIAGLCAIGFFLYIIWAAL